MTFILDNLWLLPASILLTYWIIIKGNKNDE